jgi:uncharacterized protein (TIGR02246 family)
MKVFRPASVLLAALAIGACAPAPNETAPDAALDTTADEGAIGTLRSNWVEAFNAGDTARLSALYTSDAVVMPEDQPPVTGPGAIGNMVAEMRTSVTPRVEVDSEEAEILGDWAFDRGHFTMTLTPMGEGAQPMTQRGSYLVLLHRENGEWKIAREISNSDEPTPPMPGMTGMEGATKKQ